MPEDSVTARGSAPSVKSNSWSLIRWLTNRNPILHTRTALIWALITALWLDWFVTVVALVFGNRIHEINPLGLALYDQLGAFGLAGLKAWASLLLLIISGWIRPLRAIKVLQLTLAVYALILVWNGLQLALFL